MKIQDQMRAPFIIIIGGRIRDYSKNFSSKFSLHSNGIFTRLNLMAVLILYSPHEYMTQQIFLLAREYRGLNFNTILWLVRPHR